LVDYAVQGQRDRGLSAHDAMMQAGPVRLRPILMTTMATMCAAIPPALALGPGAETRGPMAVAIIGGLVISTALSLLVVPAFFVVADRVKTKLATLMPRHAEEEPEGEEATAH
ncbi:MAG TPA: efflux RND transporter permease subunit, partial [Thermoanaerobaculia bacterium]|nr:efflux RND transporter permease subunit [Thermoanaerobaculia bacterium]